jgi:arylsulfatase A-like enzyme
MYEAGQPKRNGLDEIPGILDWGPLEREDSEMDDYKMAQFAIDKLQKDYGDQPFFIGCGIYLPHVPWYAPQKYFDMYPIETVVRPLIKHNDLDDIPAPGIKAANVPYHDIIERTGKQLEATQGLLASITFADTQVGRILDALEASPYNGNTIVVLWGDNGVHLGQKQHWNKDTLWREATHTPMMISVPKITEPGSVCNAVVGPFSLYPTLAELCEFDPPKEVEGRSIVPLLKDPTMDWPYPVIMARAKGQIAIRRNQWRYIRYENGSEELYNLDTDPYEWYNLANKAEYDEIKKELKKNIPETGTACLVQKPI